MKRPLLLLSLVSMLGALTFACAEDPPSTLEGGESLPERGTIAGGDDDDDDGATTTTNKTDPAPATSSSSKETPKPPTTSADKAGACDPKAAKTAAECTKCCAEKASPATKTTANACACGAGSKCGTVCGDNLCAGKLPDFECGVCLFTEKCDFGDLGDDLGGANAGDSAACFKQCEDKP